MKKFHDFKKIILTLQSVGKQEKYKLCFVWRIEIHTQRVRFTMWFVNVGKDYIGETKKAPCKVLNQQNTKVNISTMFLPGKFYATPLKRHIGKIWRQYLQHY